MTIDELKILLREYQASCERTAPGTREERLLHAMLAIPEEVGELCGALKKHLCYGQALDREHVTEELGDICWYSAMLCTTLEFGMEDLAEEPRWRTNAGTAILAADLAHSAGRMAHCIDALVAGSESAEVAIGFLLGELVLLVRRLCSTLELDFPAVLAANHAKLAKRYASKWTAEEAQARADKAGAP